MCGEFLARSIFWLLWGAKEQASIVPHLRT